MDIFDAFAMDERRLEHGVWRVFDAVSEDVVDESEIGERAAVLLGSTDNPKYAQLLEAKLKPHMMRRGMDVPKAVKDKLIAESLAEMVILDWRNWTINGEAFPYSKQAVLDIWTQPKWVRLKDRLLGMIGDTDVFKAEQQEKTLGN